LPIPIPMSMFMVETWSAMVDEFLGAAVVVVVVVATLLLISPEELLFSCMGGVSPSELVEEDGFDFERMGSVADRPVVVPSFRVLVLWEE